MQVMKLSFALISLFMVQTAQAIADDKAMKEIPTIPVARPSGLPKDKPVGDFNTPRPNQFSPNKQFKPIGKVHGKLLNKGTSTK